MSFKAFLIISLFSLTVSAEEIDSNQLLAEIKPLLTIPPIDEKQLNENGYVDLLTIDAPEYSDYVSFAKEIIIKNNRLLQQAVANQDKKLFDKLVQPTDYYTDDEQINVKIGYGQAYLFPCDSLANLHCVKQIIKNRKCLETLIKDNAVLLARYKRAQAKPYYHAYPMVSEMPIPRYIYFFNAYRLRLAQAIFAINDGNVRAGLTILQEEMSFVKNKLLSDSYLIDSMMAIRSLLEISHVLAQLLDSPQLKPYLFDPQLMALLQPLSSAQQQSIANVFSKERQLVIFNSYFPTEESIKQDIEKLAKRGFYTPTKEYFDQANKLNYPLRFNKIATTNLEYKKLTSIINHAQLVLPASADFYRASLMANSKRSTIKQLYQKYGDDNLLGGILLEEDKILSYLYRFYGVNNYLWLVNTKLKIKQQAINKNEVDVFLSEPKATINPYSHQPLQWDAATQTLSSDWLFDVDIERDGKRAGLFIQFNN